ncbi:MAG TPA: hypothetical protein VHR88_03120, partial [Solirubrobacteraceae bacterium]|nr:hypothetical protein [Solirubrobacteraceae bacterium]
GSCPCPTSRGRGKAAYKAIQYMGAGGGGRRRRRDGGDRRRRRAADVRAEGWLEALHALDGDADLRTRVGARGRARAEEGFSVRRWAPALAALLRPRD